MPFVKEIHTPVGPIAIWKLSDSLSKLSSLYTLRDSEQEKFERITSERRKKEFLASRILTQKLAGIDQEIIYNKSGKPFLKDRNTHISISHSADFAVVFISDKKNGIDVEQTTRNIDKIATRFLHPTEQEFIERQENRQLLKILFWSAKEAIFKCSGYQGIQFNQQIQISDFNNSESNEFTGNLHTLTRSFSYKLYYFIIENNVMVYCVEQ
uniref:4'-phosphopantetheinyl transferase family protein n=1 Tax=uncultured Draconibacterium sp. TaxID=1573823 RepID=UPI00321699C5